MTSSDAGRRHRATKHIVRFLRVLTDEFHLLRLLGPRLALAVGLLEGRVVPPRSGFGNSNSVKALAFPEGIRGESREEFLGLCIFNPSGRLSSSSTTTTLRNYRDGSLG